MKKFQASPLRLSRRVIDQIDSAKKISVSPNKDLFTLAQDSEKKYFDSLLGKSRRRCTESFDKMTITVSPLKEREMKNKQKL